MYSCICTVQMYAYIIINIYLLISVHASLLGANFRLYVIVLRAVSDVLNSV
jgi:hypothetical protein